MDIEYYRAILNRAEQKLPQKVRQAERRYLLKYKMIVAYLTVLLVQLSTIIFFIFLNFTNAEVAVEPQAQTLYQREYIEHKEGDEGATDWSALNDYTSQSFSMIHQPDLSIFHRLKY